MSITCDKQSNRLKACNSANFIKKRRNFTFLFKTDKQLFSWRFTKSFAKWYSSRFHKGWYNNTRWGLFTLRGHLPRLTLRYVALMQPPFWCFRTKKIQQCESRVFPMTKTVTWSTRRVTSSTEDVTAVFIYTARRYFCFRLGLQT